MVIHCQGDDAADDLKNAFSMCKIEEISKVPSDGVDGEEDWEDYDGDSDAIDDLMYNDNTEE